MDLSFQSLLVMVRLAVTNPRASLREVLSIGIPARIGWMALLLMAVLSALLSHVSFALMPMDAQSVMSDAMSSPIRTAMLQWVAMFLSVHLIYRIGQARGGQGTLTDTVVAVAWLQFILLVLQVVQILVQILLPGMGNLISLVSLGLFFWLLTNFIAELHGFVSLGRVLMAVILMMVAVAFVLAMVFTLFFGVPQAPGV
jgi:hypothetical protein